VEGSSHDLSQHLSVLSKTIKNLSWQQSPEYVVLIMCLQHICVVRDEGMCCKSRPYTVLWNTAALASKNEEKHENINREEAQSHPQVPLLLPLALQPFVGFGFLREFTPSFPIHC
jgi:hypothetical protein